MMRVFWRCRRERERGANLVEFALVLPLLLLMLVGIADLGRAFTTYIAITNAAREGARYGAKRPWFRDPITQAVIDEAANSGVTLTDDEIVIAINGVEVTAAEFDGDGGDPLTITVNHDFPLILGGLLGLSGGTIPLRTSTSMMIFGLPKPG